MKNKLRFGEFLIQRGVASPADVLGALDQQNDQRKPFHRAAVDLGFLSMKDAYAVYNHRAGTEETFEEAAVKLGHLTLDQVEQIRTAIETQSKRLGEILVAMNVVTSRTMIAELREFKELQRRQEEFRSQIERLALFDGLGKDFLDDLAGIAVRRVCEEERTLFVQEAPADRLWAVTAGVVILSFVPEEEGADAEVWKSYLHPGEVFGETVLFAPEAGRPASAVADAGSVLVEWEQKALSQVLNDHPSEAARLLRRLLARIAGRLADADLSLGALGVS